MPISSAMLTSISKTERNDDFDKAMPISSAMLTSISKRERNDDSDKAMPISSAMLISKTEHNDDSNKAMYPFLRATSKRNATTTPIKLCQFQVIC